MNYRRLTLGLLSALITLAATPTVADERMAISRIVPPWYMQTVQTEENFEPTMTIDAADRLNAPDRKGLRRDTLYFIGYQVATVAILYSMPESVTGWSDEQKDQYSMAVWWDNVTHPQWDSDDFYINYVLHPYWGAAYYVRARERGYDGEQAFWYSALMSSLYEFGVEALFEEPSIQDIVVTPFLGSLLGHYFMDVRVDIIDRELARGYRRRRDKLLWAVTDPLGTMNRFFDKLFGIDVDVQLQPYYASHTAYPGLAGTRDRAVADPVAGLRLHIAW